MWRGLRNSCRGSPHMFRIRASTCRLLHLWPATSRSARAGFLVVLFLHVVLELQIVQLEVFAPLLHEAVVGSLLDDPAVDQRDDPVGIADRGETVGDDKGRAAPHQ